ncbi:MAG TPA: glycoside hydrolase family 20 zincin-like fold domain-containing protein [Armatimonadota bacterium]|jgi:hypothetical protein
MLRYFVALALAASAAHAAPLMEMKSGDLRFQVNGGSRMTLFVRNVPVFRDQSLFVIKPGWTGVYIYQDDATPKCASSGEGGVQVGTAEFTAEQGYARYRFELRPDLFTLKLTYGCKAEPPAEATLYTYLNANLFEGAPYTANGGRSGKVPLVAPPAATTLLRDISQITFQTKLGPVALTIEDDGKPASMRLDDYRKGEAEWARKNPMLWLGMDVKPMPAPGEKTLTMTYRFSPPAAGPLPKSMTVKTTVTPDKSALGPFVPDFPIIPKPKEMDENIRPYRLSQGSHRIIISDKASEEEKQAARELQSEFRDLWDTPVRILKTDLTGWDGGLEGGGIYIIQPQVIPRLMAIGGSRNDAHFRALMKRPEGYALSVDHWGVIVFGSSPRGAYNGAQTLKQLVRADERGVFLKGSEIGDWPTLGVRGVHWFGGRNSHPFHKRMIENIAAPLKLNTMLFEVEYADWEAVAKPDAARGMSKTDVKKTVDLARAHFMEPIPEVTSFGNSDWMFVNGQNKDLLYSDNKRSFDPHNPKSYELLFKVFQEAIDLFQPKYLHIGHDEITVKPGSLPPAGETESAVKLIVDDVTKVHDWLKQRNVKTMMWGDELVHFPEEATDAGNAPTLADGKAMREQLPKDIVIADWHYQGDSPRYPSFEILKKAGFDVIGCSWFDRNNIRYLAKAITAAQGLGMIQTTWAGWIMSEDIVLKENLYQFVAYLLAAEHAWNGGKYSLDELGYDPEAAFRHFWDRKPVDRTLRPGFTVQFRVPGSEFRVTEPKPSARGTRNSKLGTRLAGVSFAQVAPLALAGALSAGPVSVTLPLGGKKASELAFLWSGTLATAMDTEVATLNVMYADGKTETVPVLYGVQIAAATDQRAGDQNVTVNRKSVQGIATSQRVWRWTNPRPGTGIKSVTVESKRTECAPVLGGLTGIS